MAISDSCDVSPPDDVIDDIDVVAQGDLARFIATARAAVNDFRDVRVAADRIRRS